VDLFFEQWREGILDLNKMAGVLGVERAAMMGGKCGKFSLI